METLKTNTEAPGSSSPEKQKAPTSPARPLALQTKTRVQCPIIVGPLFDEPSHSPFKTKAQPPCFQYAPPSPKTPPIIVGPLAPKEFHSTPSSPEKKKLHEKLAKNGIQIVQSGLKAKDKSELHLGIMRDRQTIQNGSFLDQIAILYRDIYGHGQPIDSSWSEYMKCTGCGDKKSIEEVFGLSTYMFVEEVEKEGPPEVECECCNQPMEVFFPLEKLTQEIRDDFATRDLFAAFLVDDEGKPNGFEYGWNSTVQEVWEDRFQNFYAGSSMTHDKFLADIAKNGDLTPDSPILYLSEIGHIVSHRTQQTPFDLISNFLGHLPNRAKERPILLTTEFGLHSHALLRAAGCWDISHVPDNKRVTMTGCPVVMANEYRLGARPFVRKHGQLLRKLLRSKG